MMTLKEKMFMVSKVIWTIYIENKKDKLLKNQRI